MKIEGANLSIEKRDRLALAGCAELLNAYAVFRHALRIEGAGDAVGCPRSTELGTLGSREVASASAGAVRVEVAKSIGKGVDLRDLLNAASFAVARDALVVAPAGTRSSVSNFRQAGVGPRETVVTIAALAFDIPRTGLAIG